MENLHLLQSDRVELKSELIAQGYLVRPSFNRTGWN